MTVDTGQAQVLQRLDELPPLRHRVYEQLQNLISSGVFAAGSRLVEGELAQTLGVSRGPIREALQLLSNDGFVDLRPRQGAFVHTPTPKEVQDFFDIRRALEVESARLAALRVTAESAQRMRDAIQLARDMLDRGEDPSAVQRQVKVHDVIAATADSEMLQQMLATLGKRAGWYLAPFNPGLRRRAWDEHERIVKAIIRGDGAGAAKWMTQHLEGAQKNYLSFQR